MNVFTYVLLAVGAILFSSCATTTGGFKIKEADQLPINRGVINQVNKTAEYRVDSVKIQGTYTGDYERKLVSRSIQLAKELAVGDAVSKAKCDFLIGPAYNVDVNGKSITAKVIGYPAHYTEFMTQTEQDSVQLVINKQVIVPTSNQAPDTDNTKTDKEKKRRRLLKIGAVTYLSIAAIVGITLSVSEE
jgi:hypothetical protein